MVSWPTVSMPAWALDPSGPLADLALSSRPCVQGQILTTSGVPVLRLFVGSVPEDVLGAYGSADRYAREDELLECIAVDLHESLQYLSWIGKSSRGSDRCCLEAQFLESATASAARQRLVDAGELTLVIGDQEVAIRAQHRPSRPHATHITIQVHRLPPVLRKQGVVQLLLECAGYSQQQCSVLAEYAPPMRAQDGRPLPVLRGDVVVAHVQIHHSAPLSLPRALHFGMQRISLQVTKPHATKLPQQPSTSSTTPAAACQQPVSRTKRARRRRQREAAATATTTTPAATPAAPPVASSSSSVEPQLPAPQAGSSGLLSAAEKRKLSGRSATCSGRALPANAQGELALDMEPTVATHLRSGTRIRHGPQPYWMVRQTHSDLQSRPTPDGAGAAQ